MIFTEPASSEFESDEHFVFLDEKEFFDFQEKEKDHQYLTELLNRGEYLLIR